jgi:hypothetical protein
MYGGGGFFRWSSYDDEKMRACVDGGDMHFRRDDYGKAKELYTRVLTVTTGKDDIVVVQERLEYVEEAIRTQ